MKVTKKLDKVNIEDELWEVEDTLDQIRDVEECPEWMYEKWQWSRWKAMKVRLRKDLAKIKQQLSEAGV